MFFTSERISLARYSLNRMRRLPKLGDAMIDGVDEGRQSAPKKRGGPRDGKGRSGRSAEENRSVSPVDRAQPSSPEAEKGVLCCILLAPNESLSECLNAFNGSSEPFYDLRHRTIYETLVRLFDSKSPITLLSVQQILKERDELDLVGGVVYLAELMDAVPSAINLEYFLKIVKQKYILRRLISVCSESVNDSYEHQGDVEELLDKVESAVMRITQDSEENQDRTMKQLVNQAIDQIQEYHARDGGLIGIGTGFPDLDEMTSGLKPGEMFVIAARPSMGKTSLAMNMVEAAVLHPDGGVPTAVFSLEMTAESLVLRMICSLAKVNLRDIQGGILQEREFHKLTKAAGMMASAPLYIDDTSGLSILQLKAKARRLKQQHDIQLIVIDYLQLLHSTSARADNRQQEIADISTGVKSIAKELGVPVIVLSQLNRELEKDKNRKPRLSDLRESGSIEQDADVVSLLYRPASDEEEGQINPNAGIAVNLLLAKQRNGPTGDVPLTFMKAFTRYESRASDNLDDIPVEE